jgi:hypothetical protein
MKTQAFVSLVFGLALLGSTSSTAAADTFAPAKFGSPPAPLAADSARTLSALPAELPEAASVAILPQPAGQLPEGVSLTGWVGELVKLAEAGIGQEVLLSYIDSAGTFNLGASQIIYLHDIGVSSEVITAIIQHDADIISGLRQVTAGAPPTPSAFRSELVAAFSQPGTSRNAAPAAASDFDPAPAWPVADRFVFLENFDWLEDWTSAIEMPEISPVRKPYAVPLTSPILVWPVEGRIPNVTFLRTLP